MADFPSTLYHYCTTQTFHSIVSNKSMRLSSLNLSNDTMEGRWAIERFGDACLVAGLDVLWLEDVKAYATRILHQFGGLGLCLSEAPDTLSQWRGYADDGFGICIGFNTRYLIDIVHQPNHYPTLLSVEYDEKNQVAKLRGIAEDVTGLVNAGALFASDSFIAATEEAEERERLLRRREMLENTFRTLSFHLYGMKNKAFHEEREWRLFAPYMPTDKGQNTVIYEYFAGRDRIKPYRQFDLKVREPVINEIYVGPRNITPIPVIQAFVTQHLEIDVEVKQSSATYR